MTVKALGSALDWEKVKGLGLDSDSGRALEMALDSETATVSASPNYCSVCLILHRNQTPR